MKRSTPKPEARIKVPSEPNVLRRSVAHFERFNGSDAMHALPTGGASP